MALRYGVTLHVCIDFYMIFTVESSFHALLTRYELLYTNMYLIGPSDGAVSHYALRLEIYGTTFVHKIHSKFTLYIHNMYFFKLFLQFY